VPKVVSFFGRVGKQIPLKLSWLGHIVETRSRILEPPASWMVKIMVLVNFLLMGVSEHGLSPKWHLETEN
jgi:hypothetical protein